MIKELIGLATELDKKGLVSEASAVDKIILKMSEDFGSFDENPQSEEYFDYKDQAQVEGFMRQEADAEKLADLIASGDSATGEDEVRLREELTGLFLKDEHSGLVSEAMAIVERR